MVYISHHCEQERIGILTRDRDTSEAQTLLDVQNVLDQMIRGENHGIGDETVLMPLHSADHRGLRSWRLVVVDNTNTAEELQRKRAGGSHTVLGAGARD